MRHNSRLFSLTLSVFGFWLSAFAASRAAAQEFSFSFHEASVSGMANVFDGGDPVFGSASTDGPTDPSMLGGAIDFTQPGVFGASAKGSGSSFIIIDEDRLLVGVELIAAYDPSSFQGGDNPGGMAESEVSSIIEFVLPVTEVIWAYALDIDDEAQFSGSVHMVFENVTQGEILLELTEKVSPSVETTLTVQAGDLLRITTMMTGSGNTNGLFTVDQANGIELGLRAKIPFVGTTNSNGDGTYSYSIAEQESAPDSGSCPAAGGCWNFDWTVNTDFPDSSGVKIDDLTYLLEIDFEPGPSTNFFAFDPITPNVAPLFAPFYDHSIGYNTTANGAGVEAGDPPTYSTLIGSKNVLQQSWRTGFFPLHPSLTYDPTVGGIYDIVLTAFDSGGMVASTSIQVIIGCGDGVVSGGEECDDGNNIDGDGCQGNCQNPVCGDGILDAGEECDDGNVVDGDKCSATCTADPGACCLPDGGCEDGLSQGTCQNPTGRAGQWLGTNSSCETDSCPDCDCDGESDVMEIAVCVANCIDGGGDDAGCAATCDANGDGVPNSCGDGAANCDDGNSCTVDSCGGGKCINEDVDCDDGVDCTIDVCTQDASLVCEDSGNSCATDADCAPAVSSCSVTGNTCETDADCNPTINETCDPGTAEACVVDTPYTCVSKPVDSRCDDGDACTNDTCLGDLPNDEVDKSVKRDDCDSPISNDGPVDGVCTVNVDNHGVITNVDVDVLLTHTWRGDLTITVSHGGTDVIVYDGPNNNPGDNDNLGNPATGAKLTFDDDANALLDDGVDDGNDPTGSWIPRESLSAFNGMDKGGDWTMTVTDAFAGDDGTLINFGLTFTGSTGGICLNLPRPEIDDGIACTDDSCDSATGDITNEPNDGNCDDDVDCTDDTCNVDLGDADGCVYTTNDDNCDDSDPCTANVCTDGGCAFPVEPDKDGDGCCDVMDPCPNDPKLGCDSDYVQDDGECHDVVYRAIIRSEKSGLQTVPDDSFLPDEDTIHLQNGCFVIEVWVQETTSAKTGLACAFTDFSWKGDLACQPKWTLINWNDTFDQFRAGTVDNNSGEGSNLGGCTLLEGVGVFPRWHRLATLHYDGNHPKCKNEFNLSMAEKGASLREVGEAKVFQFGSALLDVECLGFIYNLASENDEPAQPEVQPADFALFAPCWMAGGDGDLGDCAAVDWDCDGVVGPGDLNFFATAWQKGVCEPNIVVPACQLHCDTDATGNGQGTLTSRGDYMPWATRETIREFGLPVPPRDWAGWALNPTNGTDRVKTRRGNSRSTRR